jgi:hypothetical protein
MMCTMFFAQALGEYALMAAIAEAITRLRIRFEEVTGAWGVEAILVLVAAAVLWMIVSARR